MSGDSCRQVSCELAKSAEQGMKRAHAERWLGKGVGFERIRRITGYLSGSVEKFNNAKQAEVRDRVKHE